jgi:hypothetical protein
MGTATTGDNGTTVYKLRLTRKIRWETTRWPRTRICYYRYHFIVR